MKRARLYFNIMLMAAGIMFAFLTAGCLGKASVSDNENSSTDCYDLCEDECNDAYDACSGDCEDGCGCDDDYDACLEECDSCTINNSDVNNVVSDENTDDDSNWSNSNLNSESDNQNSESYFVSDGEYNAYFYSAVALGAVVLAIVAYFIYSFLKKPGIR